MAISIEEINKLTGWTLIRTAHHVERDLTATFADFDLSPVQFGVLAYLGTGESLTQAELARLVLVRPQTMADVLDGMVRRGLLVRAGPRGRGRRNPLQLTASGSEVLGAAWAAALVTDRQGIGGLGAAERRRLNAMLHQMLADVP